MATALRLYASIGFVREHDLPPIRGVPYARYTLPAAEIGAALARLAALQQRHSRASGNPYVA
jgi:hypothetical protein